MNSQNIMLTMRNQMHTQKTYHMIRFMLSTRIDKTDLCCYNQQWLPMMEGWKFSAMG